MSHFVIAQIKVNDPAWIPEYAAVVHDLVARHGGKYLSRSDAITQLEGDAPEIDIVAIIEFPSMKTIKAFIEDPEYAPFAKARQDGSVSQIFAIDSNDAAGTIPYL